RKRAAAFIVVSQASIALPFALGCGVAFALYPAFGPPGVRFLPFALFMGIAMSITAFPVLARILTDRGLSRTELGVAALTCAAVGDVTAWCLLAVVVGVSRATLAGALASALFAPPFLALVFILVRPLPAWVVATPGGAQEPAPAGVSTSRAARAGIRWTLAGWLASAATAELIGIHAIFGAFIFGAILPAGSPIARQLASHRTPVVTMLFLPAFFALTGLRTEIGLMSSASAWG